jgi:hypothetical protein
MILRYPLLLGTSMDRISPRLEDARELKVDWDEILTMLRRTPAAHEKWKNKTKEKLRARLAARLARLSAEMLRRLTQQCKTPQLLLTESIYRPPAEAHGAMSAMAADDVVVKKRRRRRKKAEIIAEALRAAPTSAATTTASERTKATVKTKTATPAAAMSATTSEVEGKAVQVDTAVA